mgnify:CR=1 FL=1|jgi:hypothetical protein
MMIKHIDRVVRRGRQKRIEACDRAKFVKHTLWRELDQITWGICFELDVKYRRGDLDVVQ